VRQCGVVAPFILFVFGWDDVATEVTYLILVTAFCSQIPKRFVWRYRPYVVGRAEGRRKDKTSSFPSRAVTCGVVYAYAVCRGFAHRYHIEGLPWYVPLAMVVFGLMAGFSRIHLGVHYPSDAIIGGMLGGVYSLLGTTIYKLVVSGCGSCSQLDKGCYGKPHIPGQENPSVGILSTSNVADVSFLVFCVGTTLACIIYVVCVDPPVSFWKKCDLVFGMLLACIVFQTTFLCPGVARPTKALPDPPEVTGVHVLWAAILTSIIAVIGVKLKKPLKHACFGLVFGITFISLAVWRLWKQ